MLKSENEATSILSIFLIFLRLGLTSFGGPIAHIGYFHHEFVERRKWLSGHAYTDLVALCQILPGPASSQVGIALGYGRGGLLGASAAWLGFTLPSALFLTLFALGIRHFVSLLGSGLVYGLMIVVTAVVAQAIVGMIKNLCPSWRKATLPLIIILISAGIMVNMPTGLGQLIVLGAGAIIGWLIPPKRLDLPHIPRMRTSNKLLGASCLLLFGALLVFFPIVAKISNSPAIMQMAVFFKAGSLVFGGGHVVLPLLQAELLPTGWVTADNFLAGYGLTQAMPGPLFTFAAYLGAISSVQPAGWLGAIFCLGAMFSPAFLLIIGALPFWEGLRNIDGMQGTLRGVNSAVIGLLLAAFYDPIVTTTIHSRSDLLFSIAAFALLSYGKIAPWLIVLVSAFVGAIRG